MSYLVFAGTYNDANGGAHNYKGCFPWIEGAVRCADTCVGADSALTWAHVFDTDGLCIVYQNPLPASED